MQLTFQPALDPFHAVFRLLRLRPIIKQHGPLHKDHVRILDFYLLFPFLIKEIRLSPKHQKYKRLSETYAYLKPYGDQPEPAIVLQRMSPMQEAAFETSVSQSLLDKDAFNSRQIQATDHDPPKALAERAQELNSTQADLLEFLHVLASDYSLSGDNGLKARTRLLEHRYDAL